MSLPATPAEITVEGLNDVLPAHARGDSAITRISLDDIGEGTGIFGEIARLDLSLATGETTSVIAKMQCSEPANLEIALMLGIVPDRASPSRINFLRARWRALVRRLLGIFRQCRNQANGGLLHNET